jgi:hypothetical protein
LASAVPFREVALHAWCETAMARRSKSRGNTVDLLTGSTGSARISPAHAGPRSSPGGE